MSGQAVISINDNQWSVSLATTYAELATGLSGLSSIPAGTGMLFILPERQVVTVDTSQMLFPIDIIFIKDDAVLSIAGDIPPGYLVTEETPCDMFLEVNAGEADLIEIGDAVDVTVIQEPGFDLSSAISFAIPLAVLGFVCAMVGGMAGLVGGSSSPPKQLRPERKATVECPLCRKVIEIPEYDRVTRSEALREHIEKEHSHHSMWLTPEQRKELEKKSGAVAVRWAEEATRPGDIKGAEAAAEYYYKKLKEVFGLGHLSPKLTEEQLGKLREVLGLPVDVAEILKTHRRTGYVP